MSVEQVGPGGVSNSYGVRGTSAKQEYDNDKEYKEVFVPKDTIPLTATVSSSGGVGSGSAPIAVLTQQTGEEELATPFDRELARMEYDFRRRGRNRSYLWSVPASVRHLS